MKNIIFLVLSTLFIISCSNNKETPQTVESIEIENEGNDQNSTGVKIPKVQFITFEDYAKVNTKAELLETFSSLDISHDTTYYAEGTAMYLRTTIYDSNREVYVNFLFDDGKDSVSFVEANYNIYNDNFEIETNQNLAAENGIYLGMSLKQLRNWNGEKINFLGFGWDYGGIVAANNQGKLKNSNVKITLDMMPSENNTDNKFYGDTGLNSEMEGILDADIYVSQMVISK